MVFISLHFHSPLSNATNIRPVNGGIAKVFRPPLGTESESIAALHSEER